MVNLMSNRDAHINMIKQQLRTGDVLDETILDLFKILPRDQFVPASFSEFAYSDYQIPLAHGQRMMTPLEEGKLLQALDLQGHETVLEIGTGTGFLTALLSKLAKKVISIDIFSDFIEKTQRQLVSLACNNVELITGDGVQGWLDNAPYDIVVFTGSLEAISETHRLQVLPGGKLLAIVGKEPIMRAQLHKLDHEGKWCASELFETNTPPLINRLKAKEFVF